ncbi:MAG: Hsp33 family molecular chaperone HslO [Gammaproteobacteria bacterium]|nr:Hsp33 family molecular chaperone HslO [Gammaproteobacteria bacterium]
MTSDFRQRFVFDNLDVRGCIVRLDETSSNIQATHHYPKNLANLLNEFSLAASLLRDSIKIDGSLTIQLRSKGAIELVMADCMTDRRVRAIAEYSQEELAADHVLALNQLGEGTTLAITITPEEGDRYQSIVPIEHVSLAECLKDYFDRSEQLPSAFVFHSKEEQALGIALHALPKEKVTDAKMATEHFTRLQMLLSTLTQEEALGLDSPDILTRLFHEESCRLFDSHGVEFGCVCSAEKSLEAVRALGLDDLKSLIEEQKSEGKQSLVVDCHFCFQRYEFEFDQLIGLFN